MRIAQVAPLAESVSPKFYGGTERVVSWLIEELVRQGHNVTLFASADSATKASLVPGCDAALRLKGLEAAMPGKPSMGVRAPSSTFRWETNRTTERRPERKGVLPAALIVRIFGKFSGSAFNFENVFLALSLS